MYTIQPNLLLCVPGRGGNEELCLVRSFFVSDAESVLTGEICLILGEHSWRSELSNTTANPVHLTSPPDAIVPASVSAEKSYPSTRYEREEAGEQRGQEIAMIST